MNFYIILFLAILKININNASYSVFDTKIVEAEIRSNNWKLLWKEEQHNGLDILSYYATSPGRWTIICRAESTTLNKFRQLHIKYRIVVNDIRRYLQSIKTETEKGPPAYTKAAVTFQNYLTLEEVLEFLESTPSLSRPDRMISAELIGTSVQNRTIKMLKIENKNISNIILIDAGMHGREWISVMTAVYFIEKLVNGDTERVLEKINWFIIPCLNPDGYYYSREKKDYTFHRKNLNTQGCLPKKGKCRIESCGVDLNRNFAFHNVKKEINQDPCADTYGGTDSFSEPESRALRDVLVKYKDRIKMYVTLHSWGPYIMYPWAYKKQKCDDWNDLVEAAQKGVAALGRTPETRYEIKNVGTEMDTTVGCAEDFAKHLGIKYSYSIKLQSGGLKHFMPDLKDIKPYCTENFKLITAMAIHINRKRRSLRTKKTTDEVRNDQIFIKPNFFHIVFLCGVLLN